MFTIIKSAERGFADRGWLKSYHTFSFAVYHNPKRMSFGPLRVINEDWINGGEGFPTHPHQNMEIITYIVSGSLSHSDSTGTEASIHPGDAQRMSAGTGIRHSEFNHFNDKVTHLLQIWIVPDKAGYKPSYQQISFANNLATGKMFLIASNDGRGGTVSMNQDVNLYALKSSNAGEHKTTIHKDRMLWLQVVSGEVTLDGETVLTEGDAGAALTAKDSEIKISWTPNSEFLFFDMIRV
ncbi:MAG: pirin family protein [Bdellovibrionaceae bacterium]|nr:pirin family protein [Pseudobdellovibrionaceae bacterium]